MDKCVLVFLILLTVFIKAAYIDNFCYEKLRNYHSKSYIKKTCKGALNRIFYKDFIREAGVLSSAANFVSLLMLVVLTAAFIVSFFAEISGFIDVVIMLYLALAALYFLVLLFEFVILNKNVKGEKSGLFGRIFTALLFCVLFVLYLNKSFVF